ncbi:uncharacterized protein EI90DRAFT_2856142, partial [Cantharellus anzutake]|uniref:uncharacterized protein n=1 Tax=Cantharellus anzutake TaxID=1750568 RepID=UPI0019083FE4
CWLVNLSGLPDGFYGLDLLQEHNVKAVKSTFKVSGPASMWAYIEKISPAIPVLQAINLHVQKIIVGVSQGKHH